MEKPDEALHQSIILLAASDGHLSDLTRPFHKYILHGSELRPDLSPQYRSDLREDWLLASDVPRRHQRSKMFQGRLAELQCARWCETAHFEVTGLEALGAPTDILAQSAGEDWAIEVKFVGQVDDEFEMVVNALNNRRAFQWSSAFRAVNYVLFRVFEAGVQLQNESRRRAAAIVLSGSAEIDLWRSLDLVDWRNPRFLGNDSDWSQFLERKRTTYGDVAARLAITVAALDDVWLFVPSAPYRVTRSRVVMYRNRPELADEPK